MELGMVRQGLIERTDVLKVAHHGSRTSTTTELLEALRPTWAVISTGLDNSFRNPHPQVLERLRDAGVRVWRTDLMGQVRFVSDGHRWRVESYRFPPPAAGGWGRRAPF